MICSATHFPGAHISLKTKKYFQDTVEDEFEDIAEVFYESKNTCLREIGVFIGSGRSQKWIDRLEIAHCRNWRRFLVQVLSATSI